MPAVTPATLKRAATNFAAWWTEARWVWTVCLRLLPDSVAAAIWTRAFCAWVQHANESATELPIVINEYVMLCYVGRYPVDEKCRTLVGWVEVVGGAIARVLRGRMDDVCGHVIRRPHVARITRLVSRRRVFDRLRCRDLSHRTAHRSFLEMLPAGPSSAWSPSRTTGSDVAHGPG